MIEPCELALQHGNNAEALWVMQVDFASGGTPFDPL